MLRTPKRSKSVVVARKEEELEEEMCKTDPGLNGKPPAFPVT
jgi:hypothetical protein